MRFSRLALAVAMIAAYPMMVTIVHEVGHALAATLLGYEVKSIWFGLDGSPAFAHIAGPFTASDWDMIKLAGGLMVALSFISIAFVINRQFILLAPFHITNGIYEMMGPIPKAVTTLMVISWLVFMAIVVNLSIRKEVIE